MKKTVSCILLAMLSMSTFMFAFYVQPIRAQAGGIIYIEADGSISPQTPLIRSTDNTTYTFTGDIINYSIVVYRSNIVINGNGHTLQGLWSETGIDLSGRANVTVENALIIAFGHGVKLSSSSSNIVSGNNITNNGDGISLVSSSGNKISGNNITDNDYGILLYSSLYNCISGNNITNNDYGIWLVSSLGNRISGNNVTANYGYGVSLDSSSSSNEISRNVITTNNYGGIWLVSSIRNKISGNSIIANNRCGILLEYCMTNDVSGNNVTGNNGPGIWVYLSSYIAISGNNIRASTYAGILLDPSSNYTAIFGNNVTGNGAGIALNSSLDNSISENSIRDNDGGIVVAYSSKDVISGNNVTDNDVAIWLGSSSGNVEYHNNFIDNSQQVFSNESMNTWDDGYPSGGNYWSNYNGTDSRSGSYQNLTGSDGIGDTPYVIDADNVDRYPLMAPFYTFNVGTWSGVAYTVDTVSNCTITNLNFNATVKTLTFNVTGTSGTVGFCRVTIPLSLMSCTNLEDWIVTVNSKQVLPPNLYVITDSNFTYIYFTYHHSTETVQITSTNAVPEFQPSMLLPLFMIITLIGAIAFKRKRNLKS